MKRLDGLIRTGILAMALAFAITRVAHAAPACSNANVKGSYGALIKGTVDSLPFAELDVVSADGNGNLTGTGTSAYNGAITPNISLSATYTVNADCTATFTFTSGLTQNAVVSKTGDEVQFIATNDPDSQVTGDAQRIDQQSCTNATFTGLFGSTLGGEIAGLPFAGVHSVEARNGKFQGSGTNSYNGEVSPVSFTGTYTVNPDCSASLALNNGITQNLAIVGQASQVLILETDNPNAVVAGVAKNLKN